MIDVIMELLILREYDLFSFFDIALQMAAAKIGN
jgi:hypothetical protein